MVRKENEKVREMARKKDSKRKVNTENQTNKKRKLSLPKQGKCTSAPPPPQHSLAAEPTASTSVQPTEEEEDIIPCACPT